jgi:RNA polymerase sigma-70 factor, ECF subfamily
VTTGSAALERAVREDGPGVLATLIRHLGGDFELAEDALQDAYAVALAAWPRDGVPTVPAAWLTTVARRKAIDRLRRLRGLAERLRTLAAPSACGPSRPCPPRTP